MRKAFKHFDMSNIYSLRQTFGKGFYSVQMLFLSLSFLLPNIQLIKLKCKILKVSIFLHRHHNKVFILSSFDLFNYWQVVQMLTHHSSLSGNQATCCLFIPAFNSHLRPNPSLIVLILIAHYQPISSFLFTQPPFSHLADPQNSRCPVQS